MFFHPGLECIPTQLEIKQGVTFWNRKNHKRKYVEVEGQLKSSLSSSPIEDVVGFWTE